MSKGNFSEKGDSGSAGNLSLVGPLSLGAETIQTLLAFCPETLDLSQGDTWTILFYQVYQKSCIGNKKKSLLLTEKVFFLTKQW